MQTQADTNLEEDCLDITKRCSTITKLVRACRAASAMGNAKAVRVQVEAIVQQAEELFEVCSTLDHTTDHLTDDDDGD